MLNTNSIAVEKKTALDRSRLFEQVSALKAKVIEKGGFKYDQVSSRVVLTLHKPGLLSALFRLAGLKSGFVNKQIDDLLPSEEDLRNAKALRTEILQAGTDQVLHHDDVSGGFSGKRGRLSAPFASRLAAHRLEEAEVDISDSEAKADDNTQILPHWYGMAAQVKNEFKIRSRQPALRGRMEDTGVALGAPGAVAANHSLGVVAGGQAQSGLRTAMADTAGYIEPAEHVRNQTRIGWEISVPDVA